MTTLVFFVLELRCCVRQTNGQTDGHELYCAYGCLITAYENNTLLSLVENKHRTFTLNLAHQ